VEIRRDYSGSVHSGQTIFIVYSGKLNTSQAGICYLGKIKCKKNRAREIIIRAVLQSPHGIVLCGDCSMLIILQNLPLLSHYTVEGRFRMHKNRVLGGRVGCVG